MSSVKESKIKVHYNGSIGWLVFWAVIWFPAALVLLATSGRFDLDGKTYFLKYDGSRGWLVFWIIVLFPVAILLMALNGVSLITENNRIDSSMGNNVPIV